MILRASVTCSALDAAIRPGAAHSESSRPTRMLPPIAAAIAAIGNWFRPAPSTDQTILSPNSRAAGRFVSGAARPRDARGCPLANRIPSARTAALHHALLEEVIQVVKVGGV